METWQKRIYDSYQSSGHTETTASLDKMSSLYYRKLISKHLPVDRDVAILDLGCGNGSLIYNLNIEGYKNVVGVDTSVEQVDNAKKLGLHGIVHDSIENYLISSDEKYEVIFLNDILEHIAQEEVLAMLDLLFSKLNKGGKLVLHLPNAEGINGMRIRYGDFTHIFAYTATSISQILRISGFCKVSCFEDKPTTAGLKGIVRSIAWEVLTFHRRLLLFIESGKNDYILSQNFLVIAQKDNNEN